MSKKIKVGSVVEYNGAIYQVKEIYSNGNLTIENESDMHRNIPESQVRFMY